jgi:hypothetical protein
MNHEGKDPLSTSRTRFFIAAISSATKKGLEPLHLSGTPRCASRGEILFHDSVYKKSLKEEEHETG